MKHGPKLTHSFTHLQIKGQRGFGEDLVGRGEVLTHTQGQLTLTLEPVRALLYTPATVHTGLLEARVGPVTTRPDAVGHSGVSDA